MARVAGLVLAGGRARRMGGEKPFVSFHGRPLVAHAIERARPQVDELLINANDADRYAAYGCEVVADRVGGFQGPLAGVLTGLAWLRENRAQAAWLATFACDAPFFPADLVARLVAAAEAADAAVAVPAAGAQHHPTFAVWRTTIDAAPEILKEGSRKMDDFIALYPNVLVPFPAGEFDPFFNINTPADLARALSRSSSEAVAHKTRSNSEAVAQKEASRSSSEAVAQKK